MFVKFSALDIRVRMTKVAFILRSFSEHRYGNQLISGTFADVKINSFYSLQWRSETECNDHNTCRNKNMLDRSSPRFLHSL